MTPPRSNAVAVGPEEDRITVSAIERGGAVVAPLADASGLVWTEGPSRFPTALPSTVEWVQLPSAGVEAWFEAGVFDAHSSVLFTSAAGAYAATVAEHALALLLAGVRALPEHLEARSWQQERFLSKVGTLRGSTVTILGAGGIGRALIPPLTALGAEVVAVNRSGRPVPGAVRTLPVTALADVWPGTDHVVIAAPATPATRHLVGAQELARLQKHSWLINVARGSLVDTDALVDALTARTVGGAGLDVTDPEPLPDGHPLWTLPNAIVTPHDSNPTALRHAAYADHVASNVARFVAGETLAARIDSTQGY
ncbi:D-isomer specific 2-hydroxyacid dehydrogenase family protein [Rhodococcus sp. 14-2470-1a]|uniref:D-isomer specific 2-hydroxyacid dehydrogenase family protein n=1 Tax=Rhodococcus sp. 14-2470-1a TaxID=2023150 RepID=UPI000B9B652D|nr:MULTISPECIES: D-isomer specific 2-hydroxyacid dehydrogenase family protein [unclassified Rhodococcus (in: high G+C Gram-positive bacteria)]OZD73072.1 hydroxyacid dehydrogenase [Rhodococcus sp. 06-1059B-a]OZF01154.1 hydroxyacid dehydrogenase [Rhodococcus sp. 15-1154-1]OZF47450.1 hydroxyacid dehydrogenase [Rhodococcus sp. 14-2470-1a]